MAVAPDFVERHVAAHSTSRTLVCGTRRWLSLAATPRDRWMLTVNDMLTQRQPVDRLSSDYQGQAQFEKTQWRWMSCISCNLSFTNQENILFDEQYVGWGFEDDDFAYRLCVDHRYDVQLRPEIWALHLVLGDIRSPLRPRTHDEISAFLHNMMRFMQHRLESDVWPALQCVGAFDFDREARTWRRTRGDYTEANVRRVLIMARDWCAAQTRTA
jgi:hypothetical protein